MSPLIVHREGAVEHWSLAQPDLDRLSDEATDALVASCVRVAGEASVRAVVLCGPRSEEIGHDAAGRWKASRDCPHQATARAPAPVLDVPFVALLDRLDTLPQLVVASVDAGACGPLVAMMSCADACISAQGALFQPPQAAGPALMRIETLVSRRIGAPMTRAWLAGRRTWTAELAFEAGLVHEVVAPEALDSAVQQTIEAHQRAGPKAVARTKALRRRIAGGLHVSLRPREPIHHHPPAASPAPAVEMADAGGDRRSRPAPTTERRR